jgi:hypothetical protein
MQRGSQRAERFKPLTLLRFLAHVVVINAPVVLLSETMSRDELAALTRFSERITRTSAENLAPLGVSLKSTNQPKSSRSAEE